MSRRGSLSVDVGEVGLDQALKELERGFRLEISPSLRRHRHAVGPAERRRLKHRKALKQQRRAAKRAEARRLVDVSPPRGPRRG